MHNFAETAIDSDGLPDNGNKHIYTDSDPYLSVNRVLRRAEESLDMQILFDPFEEGFHFPTTFVQLRDDQCRERKVVGEKDKLDVGLDIEVTDATKRDRILSRGSGTRENDGLIASESRGSIDRARSASAEVEIALGASDEEGKLQSEHVQTGEIDVGSIYEIERARLQNQIVEDGNIVEHPRRNAHKTRDIAAEVYLGMQLDRSLALSEMCPGEESQTEADCCRVEYVGGFFEDHTEILSHIQPSCLSDEYLGKVGVDSPVSVLVGVGQSAPGDFPADAGMIQFHMHCTQTYFQISKALPTGELCKCHAEKLIEA